MVTPNLKMLYLIFFVACCLPQKISFELLYHTENSKSLQYYDCIYYTSNRRRNVQKETLRSQSKQNILGVKYCRQLSKTTPLNRQPFSLNSTCHHDGALVSFSQLKSQNVSAIDVLKFSSNTERGDKYAAYLSSATDNDDFLCNCPRTNTFGQFCEYQFYYNALSFDEAITKQFDFRQSHVNANQFHSNRPCYTTLECDSGLMCLDWRNVCDGKCFNGLSVKTSIIG
jgi:hypothetical protein